MKKIILALAAAAASLPAQAGTYADRQKAAKIECAQMRSFGRELNTQLPKTHASIGGDDWGTQTEVVVSCIDAVIELQVFVDPAKLYPNALEGRFLGTEHLNNHKQLCDLSSIQDNNWSFWILYYSRFNNNLATTKISQESCKEYGVTK